MNPEHLKGNTVVSNHRFTTIIVQPLGFVDHSTGEEIRIPKKGVFPISVRPTVILNGPEQVQKGSPVW
jgi:hypothetical protein